MTLSLCLGTFQCSMSFIARKPTSKIQRIVLPLLSDLAEPHLVVFLELHVPPLNKTQITDYFSSYFSKIPSTR